MSAVHGIRRHTWRIHGVAAGFAAVALCAFPAAPASAVGGEGGAKPTVVLVHGAFADGSSWNGVVSRLQQAGFPVIAPANPLRGLASDAEYIHSVLKSVRGPVVLVGHSYGGAVISEAAVGDAQVKALVYIAAFAPAAGESSLELSGKFPGSTLGPALDNVPFPLPGGGTGIDQYIKAGKFHDQFAADVPRSVTDLMAATQRPVAASALVEKATRAAWKTIPSWTLITTEDRNIPPAVQRFMAQRAHAHTVEVNASHAVSVSQPGAVARLIEQAAQATATTATTATEPAGPTLAQTGSGRPIAQAVTLGGTAAASVAAGSAVVLLVRRRRAASKHGR
ncbi:MULTISPECIES: alpha/beta fold hydrolase [unclassified Streptomyces]|uniref:alpha/beta fold hydrolase n=1 Tax=unclassified Streptomyces TaxID=2593676 RepID=UPI0011AA401B|nr:alpha/beta hydrolase [Streptomyces sp. BK340]TVZ79035.1 pimeloyl-ACP methyl ester carboxylesterase [Streptomyces sp. BK340]